MKKTVQRYFLIYMSFWLTLMALIVPMYFVTMNALEENTQELHKEALAAGLARFDNELNTALQVACALHDDQYVRTLSYMQPVSVQPTLKEAYNMIHALDNFSTMSKMLSISSDSGLLMTNDVVLASNRAHLLPSEYYGIYLAEQSCADFAAWKRALTYDDHTYKLTRMRVTTSRRERDCVVFSVGVPLFSSWNSVYYAVFDEADVLNMLALPEALESGALTLSWRGEKLIEYSAQAQSDTVAISAAGGKYALAVELALDRNIIAQRVKPYRTLIIIALAGIALGGLVISFVYARRNAKPFVRLLRAAEAASGESDDALSGYEYMARFISKVDVKLKDNRLKLANQEAVIRENLLERLLRGDMDTDQHYKTARAYLPEYPSPSRIFVVRPQDAELMSPQERSNLLLKISDIFTRLAPATMILHYTSDSIVAFLPDDNADALATLSQRIGGEIAALTGIEYQLCVSEPCLDMEQIHRAYLRAQNAMMRKNLPVQILEARPDDEENTYAGVRYADTFYEQLSRAQLDSALGYLNEDIYALSQYHAVSEIEVEQLFYAYRLALSRVIDENELTGQSGDALTLPKYARRANIREACEPLALTAETLCERIARTREESATDFEQSVLKAVDERVSDPNLSVQMMMALFSVSSGTLQRIMHATSGRSFLEYVTQKRMALAKELLTETDTPIREIVRMTGYLSENSFYKTFKRKYGTSPAAMRQSVTETRE